jgi:hypothetical protein
MWLEYVSFFSFFSGILLTITQLLEIKFVKSH